MSFGPISCPFFSKAAKLVVPICLRTLVGTVAKLGYGDGAEAKIRRHQALHSASDVRNPSSEIGRRRRCCRASTSWVEVSGGFGFGKLSRVREILGRTGCLQELLAPLSPYRLEDDPAAVSIEQHRGLPFEAVAPSAIAPLGSHRSRRVLLGPPWFPSAEI